MNTLNMSDAFFIDLFDTMSTNKVQSRMKQFSDRNEIDVVVAGFDKDSIDVSLNDDALTLTATQLKSKNDEEFKFGWNQMPSGNLNLKWKVSNVDEDKIKATIVNGLLTIVLPYKSSKKVNISVE